MKYCLNFVLIGFLFVVTGCEKNAEIQPKEYPYVITNDVMVFPTAVVLSADVIDYGKEQIIDFGFVVKNSTMELQISLFEMGGSLENFTYQLSTDLEKGKSYFCNAYIKTLNYQVNGNKVNFVSLGSKAPEIIDFYPKEGFDGTHLTLVGKYFSIDSLVNTVFVNGVEAEIIKSKIDTLVFITPAMEYVGDASVSIEVLSNEVFSEEKFKIHGPHIQSISNTSAHSGNYLSIEGENLIQNGENVEVLFDTYNAEIISSSATKIEVIVPTPIYSLLSDISLNIKLVNGLKTATYDEPFLIEKSWAELQPPPPAFGWIWQYKAFTYNEKGYILEINSKVLYEYNPQTNQWQSISNFPGERNEGNIFIVNGDKVIKLGGYNVFDPVNEVWEYNFINDTWIQKEDMPFNYTCATSFTLNNEVYIIANNRQVRKYDPQNNSFTVLNAFPVNFTFFVSSFTSNNIAYAVTYGQTWQYNPQSDSWEEKANNPFHHYNCTTTIGFAFNESGYGLEGGTDLYKYHVAEDVWILTSKYPGSYGYNSSKTTFIIGDKAYLAATDSNYSGGAPLLFSYFE